MHLESIKAKLLIRASSYEVLSPVTARVSQAQYLYRTAQLKEIEDHPETLHVGIESQLGYADM
jgi:hypothetical protein